MKIPFHRVENHPATVEAPNDKGVRHEVGQETAVRHGVVTTAHAKVIALGARELTTATIPRPQFMQADQSKPPMTITVPALTETVQPYAASGKFDIIDEGLRHAAADMTEVNDDIARATIAEAEDFARQAARQAAAAEANGISSEQFFAQEYGMSSHDSQPQPHAVTAMPDSEYDQKLEATAYNPMVDAQTEYANKLYDQSVNDARLQASATPAATMDQAAIRASVQDAYGLAA